MDKWCKTQWLARTSTNQCEMEWFSLANEAINSFLFLKRTSKSTIRTTIITTQEHRIRVPTWLNQTVNNRKWLDIKSMWWLLCLKRRFTLLSTMIAQMTWLWKPQPKRHPAAAKLNVGRFTTWERRARVMQPQVRNRKRRDRDTDRALPTDSPLSVNKNLLVKSFVFPKETVKFSEAITGSLKWTNLAARSVLLTAAEDVKRMNPHPAVS